MKCILCKEKIERFKHYIILSNQKGYCCDECYFDIIWGRNKNGNFEY